jgi:hypothetical protein
MSKGWYVKVDMQVVFNVDANVGVVASTEEQAERVAEEILRDWLVRDDYHAELEKVLPWELEMGSVMWHRGGDSARILFDTIQAVSATPDLDFDPDEDCEDDDEDDEHAADVAHYMRMAQLLNESFWHLSSFHPLMDWKDKNGVDAVRDQLNLCALYCSRTYRMAVEDLQYDGPVDVDFVPKFLERCVNDVFMPRSNNTRVLLLLWRGI